MELRNQLSIGHDSCSQPKRTTQYLNGNVLLSNWWSITYFLYAKFTVYTDHYTLSWLMNITNSSALLTLLESSPRRIWFLLNSKGERKKRSSLIYPGFITTAKLSPVTMTILCPWLRQRRSDLQFPRIFSDFIEQNSMMKINCYSHRKCWPIQIHSIPRLPRKNLSAHNCTTGSAPKRAVGLSGVQLPFLTNGIGLRVRTVQNPPQIVAPHNLKKKFLHEINHNILAGHLGGRQLYHGIRKHYYWPSFTVDCYATVRLCPNFIRNRIKLRNNIADRKLFSAKDALDSVCKDILGELIRIPRGNRCLIFTVDRFIKLVWTIPVKVIYSAQVTKHVVHDWVFHYGPRVNLVTDNGKHFRWSSSKMCVEFWA